MELEEEWFILGEFVIYNKLHNSPYHQHQIVIDIDSPVRERNLLGHLLYNAMVCGAFHKEHRSP